MKDKMKSKIRFCIFVIARKLGYINQEDAALGFAEGWYMRDQQEEAYWQSVEEAFANSELQDLLPELNFTNGDLAQFYFDSLSPVEKLSFIKCKEQKEGFVLVPVEPTGAMVKAGSWNDHAHSLPDNHVIEIYKDMIKAAQEDE